MTKQVKADEATSTEAPKADTVTISAADFAALMAKVDSLAAAKAPQAEPDFSAEIAAAEAQGFKAKVVPSLQKGAATALRVDY